MNIVLLMLIYKLNRCCENLHVDAYEGFDLYDKVVINREDIFDCSVM